MLEGSVRPSGYSFRFLVHLELPPKAVHALEQPVANRPLRHFVSLGGLDILVDLVREGIPTLLPQNLVERLRLYSLVLFGHSHPPFGDVRTPSRRAGAI